MPKKQKGNKRLQPEQELITEDDFEEKLDVKACLSRIQQTEDIDEIIELTRVEHPLVRLKAT